MPQVLQHVSIAPHFIPLSFAIGFIVATYMTNTKEINSNKFI
jgi:hypothetical protein